MTFTFYNDMGSFKLFGTGDKGFSVCSVSGLESVEKTRGIDTYIGEDGAFENSSQYLQRIITISGDLKVTQNSKAEISNAMRVLSRECTLLIESEDKKREIIVNSATFTLGKSYTKYQSFVIQLVCDYPHFTDVEKTQCSIFKINPLLSKDTVLPAKFSERLSSGVVNNTGDLKIYPVVTITKKDDILRDNIIMINNNTTNKGITINKTLVKDEVVTIDIKNRTIKSSVDGNVLGTLDLYSSLSDFWCDCGENDIDVFIDGEQSGTEIEISYYNEYLEAI